MNKMVVPCVSKDGKEGPRNLHRSEGKYLTMESVLREIPAGELEGLHAGHPRLVIKDGKKLFKYQEMVETTPREYDLIFDHDLVFQIQSGTPVLVSAGGGRQNFAYHTRHSPISYSGGIPHLKHKEY